MAAAIGKKVIRNGEVMPATSYHPKNSSCNTVYEVMRVMEGKPLFFTDHYNRFERSVQLASFKRIPEKDKLLTDIMLLLKENCITTGNIWFEINAEGSINILQLQHNYPAAQVYDQGVCTLTIKAERKQAEIKQTDVKQGIENTIRKTNSEKVIFEYLLVNHLGEITEGSRSNIFFIKDNTLYTAPDEWVLKGITRQKVLTCAQKNNIAVEYKAVPLNEIDQYQAAFITGTSPKVLPIAQINAILYQTKNPLLKRVMLLYDELIRQDIALFI